MANPKKTQVADPETRDKTAVTSRFRAVSVRAASCWSHTVSLAAEAQSLHKLFASLHFSSVSFTFWLLTFYSLLLLLSFTLSLYIFYSLLFYSLSIYSTLFSSSHNLFSQCFTLFLLWPAQCSSCRSWATRWSCQSGSTYDSVVSWSTWPVSWNKKWYFTVVSRHHPLGSFLFPRLQLLV